MTKALVLASTVLLVAMLAAGSTGSALSEPESFTLLGLPERFEPIAGFSETGRPVLGAQVVIAERLHRLKGGKQGGRVGRTEILCTVIGSWKGSHRSPSYCTAGYSLPAGAILAAGFGPSPVGPTGATIPIVGGTGAYSNARGYVRVRDLPGFRTTNEFHLLP